MHFTWGVKNALVESIGKVVRRRNSDGRSSAISITVSGSPSADFPFSYVLSVDGKVLIIDCIVVACSMAVVTASKCIVLLIVWRF
jgi:hypothetical protein